MNETVDQVVIWINHSRSHAQEKAPAVGKNGSDSLQRHEKKRQIGEEINNEKGNSMERE
jgi:hypothetical protein